MWIELATLLVLIAFNGLLAGAEIAVVSVRRTRIKALVDEARRGAAALGSLRDHPERFLATVQIGITVVGTSAGAFGGASLSRHLEPVLRPLPYVGPYSHDVAFGVVVALVSFLTLVLGELVPKSLAMRAAEPYALLAAKPLGTLAWLARPLVWFLTASSNLVLRPFADSTNFTESRLSREELQQLVDEAAKSGALDARTSEIASRALEFDQLTAADIMVPRNRIVALPRNADAAAIRRCLLEERRSRIPIFEGTLDNIIGYVTAKDLLPLAWEGQLIVLADVLRPVRSFTETTPAQDLLQFMRRERQQVAVVADEHGAIAGLVAFEDLVEELVGEIFSEHDRQLAPAITREPLGTLLVRGDAALREVTRELTAPLDAPDGITTVAGLCSALAGGVVPQRGARLAERSGAVVEVLDATARTVRRARIYPRPEPVAPSDTEA